MKALVFFLIFIFISPAISAHALETQGGNFILSQITFSEGGGDIVSSNYNFVISNIGEEVVSVDKLISSSFSQLSGQIYILFPLDIPVRGIRLISDLRALTELLGVPIQEGVWQRDSDPYFYWHTETEPSEIITGFSTSLDTAPDAAIDTTKDYYQFSDNSIFSGQHTFYVLPIKTGGVPDPDSLLKFNLWVDLDYPVVSQLQPLAGEFTTNNHIPISCVVSDTDSGLDQGLTTLTINERVRYFSYDSESKKLEYTTDTSWPEGKNTVMLKSFDLAGNYVVTAWNFIVDTQKPTGSILLNNGEQSTHSAYVFINIQAKDATSGIKNIYISNDGIFDTELKHPYTYAPIISGWLVSEPNVDGPKTVYVRFEDYAGNLSAIFQDDIEMKLLTPDTRIISGPPAATENQDAEFHYEATRADCKFSYKLDNLEWSAWSDAQNAHFSGLTKGNHYFYIKSAFDLNGDDELTIDEEDATPAQWVWSVQPEAGLEKLKKKILFWRR